MDVLPERLPWFIGGPLMGLCVVALYALANKPLGATGAYAEVAAFVRGRPAETWRVWFFVGLIGGGVLAAFLRGGPGPNLGYGALALLVPLGLLVPILFLAGLLMGFGARWSGGCTSGHGLRGCATLSPSSLVATATFMGTAIAVTLLANALTGGAL